MSSIILHIFTIRIAEYHWVIQSFKDYKNFYLVLYCIEAIDILHINFLRSHGIHLHIKEKMNLRQ